MSKGSGPQTQTTKQEPWEGQAPYLTDLYSKAQNLPIQQFYPGQTYATPSDLTYQAEQLGELAALGPQSTIAGSIVPSLQEQLMSPAQRFSDPLLQDALTAGLRPIQQGMEVGLQQARRDATGAGQLGGTRQGILEAEVLKDYLTKSSDVARNLYGDVYGDILTSQGRALAFAPSAMSTLMQPSSTLANLANIKTARAQQPITEAMQRFAFGQAAPGQALSQYANIAAGTILPGTQTTTMPGPTGPGGMAGAIGGAGLGSLVPFAPEAGSLFGAAGAAGTGIEAGALAGFNPYVLGGLALGGLFG